MADNNDGLNDTVDNCPNIANFEQADVNQDGIGDDKENISMQELIDLFTVERVNSSPARFDMKKLEAINGDKIRALTIDDFLSRALPFLLKDGVIK